MGVRGLSTHTRAIPRGGTPPPPAALWGSSGPTRAPHSPSCYLRFSWLLADGLKKRAGSKEGDIGPKCMARGRGGLLMLGVMGWKGVGAAYPVVWRGRERSDQVSEPSPPRVPARSASSMPSSGSHPHRGHPLPAWRGRVGHHGKVTPSRILPLRLGKARGPWCHQGSHAPGPSPVSQCDTKHNTMPGAGPVGTSGQIDL